MQFSKLFLAATAFAVASAAKFGMTPSQFVGVTVGSTFNISWYEASGPVTILLKNGEANVLKTVSTLGSGLTASSYAWSIPATLPVDYYAFEIDDASGINYSVRFQITGGPALTSSATTGSSTSGSTASTGSTASSTSSATTAATTNTSSASTSASRTSTGSSSRTSSSQTGSATSSPSSVSSAAGVASPLALVLLAFAAIITLN